MIPGAGWIAQNSEILKSPGDGINRALFRDKFVPFTNDKADRYNHLNCVCGLRTALDEAAFKELKKRKNALPGTHFFSLTTRTPLIVNLGNEAIIETWLALHPFYGFPIIPATAVKGTVRHYCQEYGEYEKAHIEKIFGSEPQKKPFSEGQVVFLDAWPVSLSNPLYVDVMTPHYGDYYGLKNLPTDNQKTNPVHFLAVKSGVEFEFFLALSRTGRREGRGQDMLKKEMQPLIAKALGTIGIGAKTGSSFGYFR